MLRAHGDAIYVPEGVHKVHPFLAAIRTNRAVKVSVCAGITLLQQGNQVVAQGGLGLARQLELAMQGLEIITNRVHGSIMRQNRPFVKSELRDFLRVRLVRLHLADIDAALVILDEQWIHGGNKESRAMHGHGKRFIIAARVLHDDADFAVQLAQFFDQGRESLRGMNDFERFRDHIAHTIQHGNHTSSVGNIHPYCEHENPSRCVTTMANRLSPSPVLSVR